MIDLGRSFRYLCLKFLILLNTSKVLAAMVVDRVVVAAIYINPLFLPKPLDSAVNLLEGESLGSVRLQISRHSGLEPLMVWVELDTTV